MSTITVDDVIAAAARIKDKVHRTPVLSCTTLDEFASTDRQPRRILFKCENLQKTGSFKIRGASNALSQMSEADLARGVVAHSSGNHAQAIASAAAIIGAQAYIVMPENAPQVKKDAVRGYGAEVVECESTINARESTCQEIISRTGATFVHPSNDTQVMAGQGTLMLEFLEQAAELGDPLDAVLVPVGGGGMLSGSSVACKALSPTTLVFGAEPELAGDARESLHKKELVPHYPPKSCADGLLTGLGTNTFPVVLENVDEIFTVTEFQIIQAMKLVWERMKQIIEPSAAVGVAVALYNDDFRKLDGIHTIGIVLCGGNVQLSRAHELFESLRT